jgi:hypothetical protein
MHFLLILGWITSLVLTSGFQSGNVLVYANPARLEIGAGQSGILQILVADASNIYGVDLQARFDPAVVEVVDADPAATGVQVNPGTFIKPDFIVRNLADNGTGTLSYVVTQLNPTPPASGRGVLFSVEFRGKTAGTNARFTITSAGIADRGGIKQPVTLQGAELVVVPPEHSTAVPTPTSTYIYIWPTLPAATPSLSRPQLARHPVVAVAPPASQPPTETQPAVQPGATVSPSEPVGEVGKDSASFSFDLPLTVVTVCGFSGAVLFFGLSVWLLITKRRKERAAKSK